MLDEKHKPKKKKKETETKVEKANTWVKSVCEREKV